MAEVYAERGEPVARTAMPYRTPTVCDYGSLADLTRSTAVTGLTEDSANKVVPFHHTPPVSGPPAP